MLFLLLPVRAEKTRDLEDYAQVYVNEFFAPDDSLTLSDEAGRKSRALAHYAYGRGLEVRGRTEEAVEAYRRVLENQPDQFFLARKTAYLLARSGEESEALALLEESLANNPDEPYAHISLSEFLATYQANDPAGRQRAFEVIEKAVERFPDEAAVYEHLVKLYLAANRREEARELIRDATARENKSAAYWLRLGRLAAQVWAIRESSDPAETEVVDALHAKALDLAAGDSGIIEQVADYYHATGRFDQAIAAYVQIITAEPDRLDLREKLARAYGGKGDEEKVISTLKEIVEIDPQNADIHKQIAGIFMRGKRFQEAIPHLQAALTITKGSATEYGALGRMMIESREFELSVEFLTEAAYHFPESPDFPFLLTFSLGNLERWEEAIEQFQATIALAKETQPQLLNEGFYFRYAAAFERLGQFEEAEEFFRKTMELIARNDPNGENVEFTATVYNYLGYMWLENDMNIDEAGELIKTAADLQPESGAIADSLGWFYFKKGEFEQAREELLRAESLIEEMDAVILDHIGQTFHQLGDRDTAIEYLRKAVELEPEKEEFSKRLKEYEKGLAKRVAPAPEKKEKKTPASEKTPAADGKKEADAPPSPIPAEPVRRE
ncbi:MAG: tetratricopeptide repeat protein [Verrucomicrobiaceae bacterium]|nr:tetratricopeptide repeat protein [Verrucomicrobiaceae bacterium]